MQEICVWVSLWSGRAEVVVVQRSEFVLYPCIDGWPVEKSKTNHKSYKHLKKREKKRERVPNA